MSPEKEVFLNLMKVYKHPLKLEISNFHLKEACVYPHKEV